MTKKTGLFAATCSITLYMLFASHSISKLPLGDEILQAALIDRNDIFHAGAQLKRYALWGHPTLYGETLLALGKIFKPHYMTARYLGAGIFMCMLAVLFLLAKEVVEDERFAKRLGVCAVFIYCTHPMAIQGSLLLDRDNTFFTLFLSLFLLFFLRDRKNKQAKSFVLCVLSFTLLMWAKLAPLPVVFLSLLLYEGLSRRERLGRDFAILLAGMILFVVTWFVYGAYAPRDGVAAGDVFFYLFKSAGTRYQSSVSGISSAADMIKTTVYLIVWLNPFFLTLSIFPVRDILRALARRQKLQDSCIFTVFAMVIFLSYIFFGRIMFGFPKYHYPMLFMFCIMISCHFAGETEWKAGTIFPYIFLALLTFLFYAVFLDDVYRAVYFDVKRSLIDSGFISHFVKTKILIQILLLCFSFLCIALVLKFFVKKGNLNAFSASLVICGMALNFSQNTHQSHSDYSTISGYGETGTSRMLRYVRERLLDGRIVLSSTQIAFYLKQLDKRSYPDVFFNDAGNVMKEIQDEKVQFFVYGVNTNTLQQIREVFHGADVKRYLQKHFAMKKIGTYTLWEKKLP